MHVLADSENGYVPTPALSHAIIAYNKAGHSDTADGIVHHAEPQPAARRRASVQPAARRPGGQRRDVGVADRANAIIAGGNAEVQRTEQASPDRYDFLGNYVADLESIIDIDAIKRAGVRIGADPLGGASLPYWNRIRDHYGPRPHRGEPRRRPTWSFMTLDWTARSGWTVERERDGVRGRPEDEFDVLTGNDADSDRHGIVNAPTAV